MTRRSPARIMITTTSFIDHPASTAPARSRLSGLPIRRHPCRPNRPICALSKPTLAAIYRLEKRFAFVTQPDAAAQLSQPRRRPTVSPCSAFCPSVNIVMRTHDHQDAIGMGQGRSPNSNPQGQAAREACASSGDGSRKPHQLQ